MIACVLPQFTDLFAGFRTARAARRAACAAKLVPCDLLGAVVYIACQSCLDCVLLRPAKACARRAHPLLLLMAPLVISAGDERHLREALQLSAPWVLLRGNPVLHGAHVEQQHEGEQEVVECHHLGVEACV